jgi:hypothetical protein
LKQQDGHQHDSQYCQEGSAHDPRYPPAERIDLNSKYY